MPTILPGLNIFKNREVYCINIVVNSLSECEEVSIMVTVVVVANVWYSMHTMI